MSIPADPQRLATLLGALDHYQPARRALLTALRLPTSNRDPLPELGADMTP